MRLIDARQYINEVHGRPYTYLQAWGLGTIKEAIRTIEDRKSATAADRELAYDVKVKVWRKW